MGPISRRALMAGAGAAAALAASPLAAMEALIEAPLYPAMDLSYFDTPVSPAPADIRLGYATITWGGHDLDAIADIAAAGYPGIQLRSNIVAGYEQRPRALADELAKHHLTFVALSSGAVSIDPASEAQEIATHVGHATFLKACGGLYLQCTDTRPKGVLTPAEYRRLGHVLTEIGKRTADLGIALGYHNHMGTMGERPDELDWILDAADPKYVKLELDIAHYQQGGGDPVHAIRKYTDRLLFLHIKDVQAWSGGSSGSGGSGGPGGAGGYRFVELGRGRVDVKGVFAAMRDIKFRGWAVVELDAVPDKARTPKESALINRKYLEDCGFTFGAPQATTRDLP
jgi:inosose dehydratase